MDINALIDKYGPGVVAAAQKQVEIAVFQDTLWGIFGVVLLVLCVLSIVGAVWFGVIADGYHNDAPYVFGILAFFLGIIGLLLAISGFGEAYTYSHNPAWGVIKEISRLVK